MLSEMCRSPVVAGNLVVKGDAAANAIVMITRGLAGTKCEFPPG